MPLIVRAPGVPAGRTCSVPVISPDFYPTLLELAGLPLRPKQHVDGRSLRPLLTGQGTLQRDALFWHFPDYIGGTTCARCRHALQCRADGQLEVARVLRGQPRRARITSRTIRANGGTSPRRSRK